MNRKNLARLRRELEDLRQTQPKAQELHQLARRLGRKKVNRGKEPTFVSTFFPDARPLSIPNHKGRDLAVGTKNSILTELEFDLYAWEERLDLDEER